MTLRELLDDALLIEAIGSAPILRSIELYECDGPRVKWHTDYIISLEDTLTAEDAVKVYGSREVLDWRIMDADEYDNTILANGGMCVLDFMSEVERRSYRVLCVILKEVGE